MTREAELRKIRKEHNDEYMVGYYDGKDMGITETNAKWKQAIQKTLKELKEDTKTKIQLGAYWEEEDKWESEIEFNKIIDTTFKQNFGGLAE